MVDVCQKMSTVPSVWQQVCKSTRQKNKKKGGGGVGRAEKRQYDCINYKERCKVLKETFTSEVVCGNGIVT